MTFLKCRPAIIKSMTAGTYCVTSMEKDRPNTYNIEGGKAIDSPNEKHDLNLTSMPSTEYLITYFLLGIDTYTKKMEGHKWKAYSMLSVAPIFLATIMERYE